MTEAFVFYEIHGEHREVSVDCEKDVKSVVIAAMDLVPEDGTITEVRAGK